MSAAASFAASVKGIVHVEQLVGSYSPRSSVLDLDHAKRLAEVFDDLPRILVEPNTMKVIDGVHRLHAAKHHLGLAEIEVAWFAGTEDEARDAAVSLNNDHGLPLTLADRRTSARRMVERHPDWSDRRIAEACGLSNHTVADLRPTEQNSQSDSPREGRDGIQRPARRGAATEQARDYLTENPDASARQVARDVGVSADTAARVKRTERTTTSTTTERPALAAVPDDPEEPRADEVVTFVPKWTKDSRFLTDGPVGAFGRWMHKRTLPHPQSGATVDYSTWLEDVDLDACPAQDRDIAAAELRRIADYYQRAAEHLSRAVSLRSTR